MNKTNKMKMVFELPRPIRKPWIKPYGEKVNVWHHFVEITMSNDGATMDFKVGPYRDFYPESATIDEVIKGFVTKEALFAAIDKEKREREIAAEELRERLLAEQVKREIAAEEVRERLLPACPQRSRAERLGRLAKLT